MGDFSRPPYNSELNIVKNGRAVMKKIGTSEQLLHGNFGINSYGSLQAYRICIHAKLI